MRQLLGELDSYELTEWIAFFDAKHEREELARKQAEADAKFDRSIEGG